MLHDFIFYYYTGTYHTIIQQIKQYLDVLTNPAHFEIKQTNRPRSRLVQWRHSFVCKVTFFLPVSLSAYTVCWSPERQPV